jgi:pilus assembly protein CpaB
MFRRQSFVAVGVALFFGAIAVFLMNSYLSGVDRQHDGGKGRTGPIAVARNALDFGSRIAPGSVGFVAWPAESVPAGSFTDPAQLTAAGGGRFVIRPIAAGEPITASRLSGDGSRPTVAGMLGPDMRAVSVRISDVAGVSGFVLPGDRVDVIMTREIGSANAQQQVSDVLLSNVRVIAVDQKFNQDSADSTAGEAAGLKTATLEVTQPDAQKVALGAAVGTLSLALRSPKALKADAATPLRSGQLAGGVPLARPAAPADGLAARIVRTARRIALPQARRAGPSVEIVRGTSAREYEVIPYAGL